MKLPSKKSILHSIKEEIYQIYYSYYKDHSTNLTFVELLELENKVNEFVITLHRIIGLHISREEIDKISSKAIYNYMKAFR